MWRNWVHCKNCPKKLQKEDLAAGHAGTAMVSGTDAALGISVNVKTSNRTMLESC